MKNLAAAALLIGLAAGSAVADDSADRAALDKVSKAISSKEFEAIVAVTSRDLDAARSLGGDAAALAGFESVWNRCRDIEHRFKDGDMPLSDAAWAQENLSPASFERLMTRKLGQPEKAPAKTAVAASAAPPAPVQPPAAEPVALQTAARADKVTAAAPPSTPRQHSSAAAFAVVVALLAAGFGAYLVMKVRPQAEDAQRELSSPSIALESSSRETPLRR